MSGLTHIYRRPPQNGDVALCGHVREELDQYRLQRSDNQCVVCKEIAEGEGMTLVTRPATWPEGWWVAEES
jgi:hypothetical protein